VLCSIARFSFEGFVLHILFLATQNMLLLYWNTPTRPTPKTDISKDKKRQNKETKHQKKDQKTRNILWQNKCGPLAKK